MANRNTLQLNPQQLTVLPRGLDKLWGFKKKLSIPLTSIAEVTVEQHPHRVRRGLRYPGLDAYWKRSGTFHPGGELHYWNTAGSGEVLSIRLDGSQHFHQLYLSVSDAPGTKQLLEDTLGGSKHAASHDQSSLR